MQRAYAVERIPRPISMMVLRPSAVARGTVVVKCCFMAARSKPISSKCPYRTLGVSYDADEEAIKDAYRRKAKQVHPDVSGSATTALAFMECKKAYQTLLDPERRAKYDKTLKPSDNRPMYSYFNAISAARHGIPVPCVASRATRHNRLELYSKMLHLLDQVKSCAKNVEREIVGKDSVLRGLGRVHDQVGSCSAGIVASEADCGDGECCEPWLFYASQSTSVDAVAAMRRR